MCPSDFPWFTRRFRRRRPTGLVTLADGLDVMPSGMLVCGYVHTWYASRVKRAGLTVSQIGYAEGHQDRVWGYVAAIQGERVRGKESCGTKCLALGADLRLPTGDDTNFLGTGAVAGKPFAALSLYTKDWNGIIFSPHVNVGWQFAGQSILGGTITGTPVTSRRDLRLGRPHSRRPRVTCRTYSPGPWERKRRWDVITP